MTPREAFKVGFLEHCAQQGLGMPEIQGMLKQADAESVARSLIGLGVIAPPVLGGAAGWALGRASNTNTLDPDEVQAAELAEEYKRQASKLRLTQEARKRQQAAGPRRIHF